MTTSNSIVFFTTNGDPTSSFLLYNMHERLRKDACATSGLDGISAGEFEDDPEGNIRKLVEDLKGKRYRARLVRRKYIPMGQGKLRPLGIPAVRDKEPGNSCVGGMYVASQRHEHNVRSTSILDLSR